MGATMPVDEQALIDANEIKWNELESVEAAGVTVDDVFAAHQSAMIAPPDPLETRIAGLEFRVAQIEAAIRQLILARCKDG